MLGFYKRRFQCCRGNGVSTLHDVNDGGYEVLGFYMSWFRCGRGYGFPRSTTLRMWFRCGRGNGVSTLHDVKDGLLPQVQLPED